MKVFKVISSENAQKISTTGYIQNEPADIGCKFIHACDAADVSSIVEKFFRHTDVVVCELDLTQISMEGFCTIKESNRPNGVEYWHFYRPDSEPEKLLSSKCIKFHTIIK